MGRRRSRRGRIRISLRLWSGAAGLAADEYRDAYFEEPSDLSIKLATEFRDHVVAALRAKLHAADAETVVALHGVGSLYGFLHVHEVVQAVEPDIRGRLVVFFPGSKHGNNYRLLDARDGWNYLATSITLGDGAGAA